MNKGEGYQALSDLVYKGFLLLNSFVGDFQLVFKTINEREFKLIRLLSGDTESRGYTGRFNINYLVYSLFMINGENIVLKRDKKYREIRDFFNNMPNIFCNTILKELTALRETSMEAIEFLEGFSYTERSRRIWRHVCNSYPSSVDFTGIPGTDKMGINVYQENWILMNKMMDSEEKYNKDFSRALFVASASNPKGVRSVRSKFDANVQRTDERRKRIAKLGSLKKRAWSPDKWSAPVDTAEELVEELMRQMSGKKDRHDKFIEKHMDKVRQRAEKERQKVQEKVEAARKRREEEGDVLPVSVSQRPLTPEEAKELENRKTPNVAIVKAKESEMQDEKNRFYKKIGSKVLTSRK